MSFLDEREDQPRSTTRRRRPPPPRGPGTDRQTLMVRRLVAGGIAVVALVLLILLIKGCRDSAREQAFKDYIRNVNEITQQSDQEGSQVFGLLAKPGKQASSVTITSDINGYRSDAQQLLDRAKSLDHPGELDGAQGYLTETLSLRRDGIAGIARDLPTALGDANQKAAIGRITIYMRSFLASDVVYSTQFLPHLIGPTRKQGLLDQVQIPSSRFMTDLTWILPSVAGSRIQGGATAAAATPGPHGTGLGTVTVSPGGTQLQQGGVAQITASPNLSFAVQVMNQGASQEQNVTVKVTVTGAGKPIVVQQQIPTIAAGQTKTANLPLAATPATGKPVTIQVEVLPVPGEKNTTNNKGSYAAVFTG